MSNTGSDTESTESGSVKHCYCFTGTSVNTTGAHLPECPYYVPPKAKVCPTCGTCPTCGHRPQSNVWPWPYIWPYTITWGTSTATPNISYQAYNNAQ